MNMGWLEKLMAQKGITLNALKLEFHVHHNTLKAWAGGAPARPHTVRKLAAALGVEYAWLVRNLGVKLIDEKKRSSSTFNRPDREKKMAR
jgi:hypothetical protein